MRSLLHTLVCCCLSIITIHAQKSLTGKITDTTDGLPLIGVSILVKEAPQLGTISDFEGHFSFSLPDSAQTLVLSYTGYRTKEIEILAKNHLEIALSESATLLDEVVVTGYGSQLRSNVTGNISKISGETIEGTPVTSFESALQGQAAGVFISSESGKLGQNINVRIRGTASLNAGVEPLYVIDGVVINSQEQMSLKHPRLNPLADINFNDIASIEILKDAAAAAIYGSRASNGVILITTKRGLANETQITLDVSSGWSSPTRKSKWLNAKQYLELWDEAFNNVADADGIVDGFTAEQWKNNFIPGWDGGYDTNWEDEIYNDDAGQKQVQLNIAGGNEKTKYYISGGWLDQTGIIITNSFKRISGRLNLTHQSSKKLDFGVNMSLAHSLHGELQHDGGFANPVQMSAIPPVQPLYDPENPDELFPSTVYFNAKFYEDNADWKTGYHRIIGNTFLNWKPIKNLTLHTDLGTDMYFGHFSRFYGSGVARDSGEPNGLKIEFTGNTFNYSTNNYATYAATTGDHHLLMTLGMSYQELKEREVSIFGRNFPNDNFQNLDSAGEIFNGGGATSNYSILSYFSRLNYDFDNKYLLSLSARMDGDSRFGKDSRYGFFPAISAGWILSKENFLKNNPNLSYLKLRASWGLTGNTPLDHFPSLGLFEGTRYAGNAGILPIQIPNPNLKWEKTKQINIGLDFGLLEDRISGQVDYYHKTTDDLLLQVNIPSTSGFTTQLQNVGSMENKGWEAMLTSYNLSGQFKWKTSLNFSKNSNRVTNIQGQIIESGSVTRAMEGFPVGVFFAPEYAGVDPDNGDALFYLNTKMDNGELDRSTTNDINQAERVVIGDPNPDFTYGITNTFSWKGIELQIFFQGVYGADIYNGAGRWQLDGFGWFDNQDIRMLNRWQNPGDQTVIPQVRFLQSSFQSSRFIEDGTYLRLKNLAISYDLPSRWIEKMGLQKLKLYLQGQNLITLTDYQGWDPEVSTDLSNIRANGGIALGEDFYTPPQAKTLVFGLKVGF